MAKNFEVKLKRPQVRKLLRGPEVGEDAFERAEAIAKKAGPGMLATRHVGARRARASVITSTDAAKRAEAEDKTLTRAIGMGGY